MKIVAERPTRVVGHGAGVEGAHEVKNTARPIGTAHPIRWASRQLNTHQATRSTRESQPSTARIVNAMPSRHRRSNSPRKSLRYAYRVELATLKSGFAKQIRVEGSLATVSKPSRAKQIRVEGSLATVSKPRINIANPAHGESLESPIVTTGDRGETLRHHDRGGVPVSAQPGRHTILPVAR